MSNLFFVLVIILSSLLIIFILIKFYLNKKEEEGLPEELEIELRNLANKINQLKLSDEFKKELQEKLDYEYNKTKNT